MRVVISAWFCLVLVACASSGIGKAVPSDDGVSAYRAKDYKTAWATLAPLVEKGHFRAQRYAAFMLLEGNAPVDCADTCATQAVDLLLDSARRGDNNALIVLEGMLASNQSYAPKQEQIIMLEQARAKRGDPVMAWRLADRYAKGDGVDVSNKEAIRWLNVVAKADSTRFPKVASAAYRLCEIYARGDGVTADQKLATRWCRRAAKNGHSGAAIVLARLSND